MAEVLAEKYASLLRQKLGNRIKQIILFGSRARGDATDDSDYDFVVVVDNRTSTLREQVLDVDVEMMDCYDVLVAPVIYDEVEWKRAQMFPFAWNINQEGIAV